MGRLKIQEIEVVLKMIKKIEKIIKSNEFTKKWYDLGHIRVLGYNTLDALLPIVEVYRLIPEVYGDLKSLNMDKATKDRITKFLKNNGCIYYESTGCYIYGGDMLKKNYL